MPRKPSNQGTEKDPDDTVSMIDTATFTVVATVKTGKRAHGVAVARLRQKSGRVLKNRDTEKRADYRFVVIGLS